MKDETTINSYELTLTPNYVSDWNFNDALRELIQNGTDQEVLDPDNEFQIDYSDDVKKVQEMLIESFDTQNPQPYSVPVDSQEDIRKVKAYGGNPVVVPAGVAKLLKKEKDKRIKALTEIPCANVMTLKDKFNRWYDVYAEDIRDEARMEIRNLIDELE